MLRIYTLSDYVRRRKNFIGHLCKPLALYSYSFFTSESDISRVYMRLSALIIHFFFFYYFIIFLSPSRISFFYNESFLKKKNFNKKEKTSYIIFARVRKGISERRNANEGKSQVRRPSCVWCARVMSGGGGGGQIGYCCAKHKWTGKLPLFARCIYLSIQREKSVHRCFYCNCFLSKIYTSHQIRSKRYISSNWNLKIFRHAIWG